MSNFHCASWCNNQTLPLLAFAHLWDLFTSNWKLSDSLSKSTSLPPCWFNDFLVFFGLWGFLALAALAWLEEGGKQVSSDSLERGSTAISSAESAMSDWTTSNGAEATEQAERVILRSEKSLLCSCLMHSHGGSRSVTQMGDRHAQQSTLLQWLLFLHFQHFRFMH